MNIIDTLRFNGTTETYTQEEILDAYKTLFNEESLPARIVLQDLLMKSGYGSLRVDGEPNIFYHRKGQEAVIEYIRDGLLTEFKDYDQIPSTVEELVEEK